MDWLKIASVVALAAMFFLILPTARKMAKNSPKGSKSDWMGFVVPMAVVVLFIIGQLAVLYSARKAALISPATATRTV